MTHEFKEIIAAYILARQKRIPTVMATVVAIDGSSYRRPGVGMLILRNGEVTGAVSGGCVEKEVLHQSQSVFENNQAKMMTYNGRYRLGCEGILYILIEPFCITLPEVERITEFLVSRIPLTIHSYYTTDDAMTLPIGSVLTLDKGEEISFSNKETVNQLVSESAACFSRTILPCFRLIIIGTEHDAVILASLASHTGWEVQVIGTETTHKQLSDFPGAIKMIHSAPENLSIPNVDAQTAFILMTHNFAKDVLYLQAIREERPIYIGLLGPSKRREKLLSALIDYFPDISDEFLDVIKGPTGLNLGAETPQEIAISIIAEIIAVVHQQQPIPLHLKKEGIHATITKDIAHIDTNKS